jgi:pyrimidine operon attenuation protein/uracil phosphoribosyltransferase
VRDEIEDEVVRLVGAGEVVAAVVDHVVGSQRPHEVELAGVVDTGHVRAGPLGQLDCERA